MGGIVPAAAGLEFPAATRSPSMKLRHALAALLSGLALTASPATFAATVPQADVETVGGVEFTLPIPPGYLAPAATPKAVHDMMEHALPPTNHLVTVMLTQQFLDELRAGNMRATKSRYLAVQSFPAFDQSGLTQEVFDQLKTVFRNQSAQLLEQAKSIIDDSTNRVSGDVGKLTGDSSAQVKSSDLHTLGIFDEQPDSISLAAVQSLSASARDKQIQMKQAMGMTALLIHGKVLMVSFYSSYDSQADVDWVEDQARAWARRMHELNP
jgi:hypothetical protein